MASIYHQRLLHDIHEITTKPYPYIYFHSHEDNINKACLVLTPPGLKKIHLTVCFQSQYPVVAPKISIQSKFIHPNVFTDYICASILNTDDGYTPAYTLKGIAIQILSFFNSDSLEQEHGNSIVDLAKYRKINSKDTYDTFSCRKCGFPNSTGNIQAVSSPTHNGDNITLVTSVQGLVLSSPGHLPNSISASSPVTLKNNKAQLSQMPAEILIRICDCLESEELNVFMRAWDKIGGADGVVTQHGLIQARELQCFALKEGFAKTRLGVGVHIGGGGRYGTLSSEFDLLSEKAFETLNIRKSVQGVRFERWLPLAISRRHYDFNKRRIEPALRAIGLDAHLNNPQPVQVLYAFMNDVVAKLSEQAASGPAHGRPQSAPKHASEKAIESYYHLFHLLLCIATEDKSVVPAVNRTLNRFLQGNDNKDAVPNLGHLLIMVLISDFDMDEALTMAIIKEAVTRNVVWMLDKRGAGMAELSYMEANQISEYRLQKTFEANKTSYRLLMFFNLFRNTVKRSSGASRKTVEQLRDEIFDARGAPPHGAATQLALDVRRLQDVNDFPNFFMLMGQNPPRASEFTTFLRQTCQDSVTKGYSVWAYTQQQALALRQVRDPTVSVRTASELKPEWRRSANSGGTSFFPNKKLGNARPQRRPEPRGFSTAGDRW